MGKGLSREAIVDAAFAVLDAKGADGLTVRALADRLGVKPPALYWHVRDKRELLDEMGTRVWQDIARTGELIETDDWRTGLAEYARTTRAGLLSHRDGARMFSGTFLTDDDLLRRQEHYLQWMEARGFDVAGATDAFAVVTACVVGLCIEEQERDQAPDDRYSVQRRDARLGGAEYSRAAESGRRMFGQDPDERFDTLLAIVLDGIALRRRRPPSSPSSDEREPTHSG